MDHNFRQRAELAALSSGFRAFVLGDSRVDARQDAIVRPAAIYRYPERDCFAELVLERIHSLPHHATVAIITPTTDLAQIWFDLLNEDLSAYHREALMSRRDDLTRRVNIHFTEVRETKGLEFDVVMVPELNSFELDNPIGRNQTYVALSRAKHALMIGYSFDRTICPEIEILERNGFVTLREVRLDRKSTA